MFSWKFGQYSLSCDDISCHVISIQFVSDMGSGLMCGNFEQKFIHILPLSLLVSATLSFVYYFFSFSNLSFWQEKKRQKIIQVHRVMEKSRCIWHALFILIKYRVKPFSACLLNHDWSFRVRGYLKGPCCHTTYVWNLDVDRLSKRNCMQINRPNIPFKCSAKYLIKYLSDAHLPFQMNLISCR